MKNRRQIWFDLFPLVALSLTTVAVYWQAGHHEFVNYDDPDYVTDNGVVQRGLSWAGLKWAFGTLHGQATYWHPLTWVSHMLDCQFFGLRAGAHHLTSVLWHTGNAVLLFLVLRRMSGNVWRSALVAGFFALHPLQVESVAWASERKNLVSAFFWLLTLWGYVRYAERPSLSRYWLVPLFFACALMAKPVLVTLPFALMLLDYWPLRRWRPRQAPGIASAEVFPVAGVGRLLLEKAPLILLAFAAGWIAMEAHRALGMWTFDYGLSPALRLENAAVSYARYVGNWVWPSDLCAIYPHPGRWPVTTVAASVALVLVVSVWVVGEARPHPYLVVGWFWFVGLLLPTIGLVQVGSQAMADRFAYLPIIGLLITAVWGFADLFESERRRGAICALASCSALVACAAVMSLQLGHWKNSTALYERAVSVTDNNFVAHSNLGYTLAQQGRTNQAMAHLVKALNIRPDLVEARYQMASLLDRGPGPAEALPHYREVVTRDPNWALARLEFARALTRLGKIDEAISQLRVVLRLAPTEPEGHSLLAMLLAGRQNAPEAILEYRESLRLRPDRPEVLNNLAWLLATSPDAQVRNGPEAVRLAARACELSGHQKAMFAGTLAAAYAESGRFAEAVQTAEKAHRLAASSGEQDLAATNLKLLELYRQEKPYREEPR